MIFALLAVSLVLLGGCGTGPINPPFAEYARGDARLIIAASAEGLTQRAYRRLARADNPLFDLLRDSDLLFYGAGASGDVGTGTPGSGGPGLPRDSGRPGREDADSPNSPPLTVGQYINSWLPERKTAFIDALASLPGMDNPGAREAVLSSAPFSALKILEHDILAPAAGFENLRSSGRLYADLAARRRIEIRPLPATLSEFDDEIPHEISMNFLEHLVLLRPDQARLMSSYERRSESALERISGSGGSDDQESGFYELLGGLMGAGWEADKPLMDFIREKEAAGNRIIRSYWMPVIEEFFAQSPADSAVFLIAPLELLGGSAELFSGMLEAAGWRQLRATGFR